MLYILENSNNSVKLYVVEIIFKQLKARFGGKRDYE